MTQWQTQLEQLRRDHRVPLVFAVIIGLLFAFSISQFINNITTEHLKITAIKAKTVQQAPLALADLHLFGAYATTPAAIPVSTLQFTLEGTIVFENDPSQSHALIASSGRPVKVYQVNDTLPGNVKISKIEKDYVVIDDNGSSAKILLPINSLLTDDQ